MAERVASNGSDRSKEVETVERGAAPMAEGVASDGRPYIRHGDLIDRLNLKEKERHCRLKLKLG
jgi:hypothetical protein